MAVEENEYPYQPSTGELIMARFIQNSLYPSPQIEFIAQPAKGAGYVWYVFRLTNPETHQTEDYGSLACMMQTSITLTAAAAIGLVYVQPKPPALLPVVLEPIKLLKKGAPPPGYIDGPFGWSKIP